MYDILNFYLLNLLSASIVIILTLLFFDISIALHELGHLCAAKLCKFKIRYVYLKLFFSRTVITPSKFLFAFPRFRFSEDIGGGVVFSSPDMWTGHEFIITLAGPIVNFVLFLGSLIGLYYFGLNLEIILFGCVNLLMLVAAKGDWLRMKDCWNAGFLNKGT